LPANILIKFQRFGCALTRVNAQLPGIAQVQPYDSCFLPCWRSCGFAIAATETTQKCRMNRLSRLDATRVPHFIVDKSCE
jgi:hypothetical protein